jgi:hypothetical protein
MHVFDSVTAQAATQVESLDGLPLNEVAARIPRRADSRCKGCANKECPGKTLAPVYLMARSVDKGRGKRSVVGSSWLVVDWDAEKLPAIETEHIAIQSHRGHWHLLVRLEREANRDDYAATAQAFAKAWGEASDKQTRHIERVLYAPHPDARVEARGSGRLPVLEGQAEQHTAPLLPVTRRAPSRKTLDQWAAAMAASKSGNNELSGALGSALARHCGYTDEEVEQTVRAVIGGIENVDKHANDAVRAARDARNGTNKTPGIPRLAERGIVFELEDELPEVGDGSGLDIVFGRCWTGEDFEMSPARPIDWISERWAIAPGAPVVLAGAGGLGKTLLAQSLALGVATPEGTWLGEPMPFGRVIHIDHEQGVEATKRRYQRLGIHNAKGLTFRHPPSKGWRLSSKDGLAWLAEVAENAKLVILDSLRASTPGVDENDSDIRTLLDPLGEVSALTGAAFVVIHHARKTGKDEALDGPEFLRGSSGITDAASAVIGLARRGEFVDMWLAKVRDPGDGTHGLFVKHSVVFRNDEHKQLHIECVESRALALQTIANAPDDLTQDEIDDLVGGMRNADKRRHYYDTHPNSRPAKTVEEKRAKHARRKASDIA